MKLGFALIFFGSLTLWQISTLFGIVLITAGIGGIGYLAVQEEEEKAPTRDYSGGGVITYDISSRRRS